jgi:hypothetical protein
VAVAPGLGGGIGFRTTVDRSTTGADPGDGVELGGRNRTIGIDKDVVNENHHLAKVRVAGSNPVFRSKRLWSAT